MIVNQWYTQIIVAGLISGLVKTNSPALPNTEPKGREPMLGNQERQAAEKKTFTESLIWGTLDGHENAHTR